MNAKGEHSKDADARDETKAAAMVASKPPPEPPQMVWMRRMILVAFWVVAICFGLPHWIWTTSIHREELPVDVMNQWAEGQACQLRYPIQVALEGSSFSPEQVDALASKATESLGSIGQDSLYTFHVTSKHSINSNAEGSDLTINLNELSGSTDYKAQSRPWLPTLDVSGPDQQNLQDQTTLVTFLAGQVRDIFSDEQATISYVLRDTPYADSHQSSDLPPELLTSLEKRSTRAFKYASSYHLTFSLFAASTSPSAWDIETAVQNYLQPLLKPLSRISNFTIDTQVQLYASFSPSIAGPQYDQASEQWKLLQSDLSGFINAAEWPLSPSIDSGPTINLVLYVPSAEQTPMVVDETGGTSWIIPQWGGVQIVNRSPSRLQAERLSEEDLDKAMLTFADQLTSLLGLPPSPPSLQLRINSLARQRTTSLILSASSTLGALVRLTKKLESIAIPSSVAQSVSSTIAHLDQACADLSQGRFQSALENARVAEEEAEKAFFEPSMVGQVYFPDEHRIAVYVPLLGPMAVPLIMAALKEIRSLRGKKVKSA